ncbi:MAG: hypothetical protein RSC76_05515 [Oscillospiraceae bacterium]
MIKLTDEISPEFVAACADSAFGCKILATALAYGFNAKIALYWLSDTAFCLWGENMTIAGDILDPCETAAFLRVLSPKTVLCSKANANLLHLPVLEEGEILCKVQQSFLPKEIASCFSTEARGIFSLLQKHHMIESFQSFYLDFSHKLRHGVGCLHTEKEFGVMVSCALSTYITQDSAIITAVATMPGQENRGLGTKAVLECEKLLAGRKIYVLKEKNKNNSFYQNLNYHFAQDWCSCKVF